MTIYWAKRLGRRCRRLVGVMLVVVAVAAPEASALSCKPLVETAVDTSEVRFPRGLLWQVSSPQGNRSVILGTMHISDARFAEVLGLAAEQLTGSRHFVMEVVLDLAAMASLQSSMFYAAGDSLRNELGSELFEAIAGMLTNHGIPTSLAEKMKPWAAYTTLSTPPGVIGVPMDLQLMLQAQSQGMEVSGLETVAQQVAIFESIDAADQVEMLREVACHYELFQSEVEQLVEAYVARDLRQLVALSLRHIDDTREAFMDALLWSRNDAMVVGMREIIDQGGAFIAVGALHLPGHRGILQQLERAGYRLEPLH